MLISHLLKASIVLLLLPRATNALFSDFFLELLCNVPIIRLLLNCEDEVNDPLGLKPTIYSNPYDGRVFSLEYNGTKATLFGSAAKEIDVPLSMLTERYALYALHHAKVSRRNCVALTKPYTPYFKQCRRHQNHVHFS
jgi:hypothetical protein